MLEDSKGWFQSRYGSRRGFAKTLGYRTLYLFGRYHQYRQMNLKDVKRLVFVCKGNICRSAFAESVAVSSGIPSVSCGVATRNELPADNMAIEAAYRRGRDLSGHLTRSIDTLALNRHDLLVAMEPWHINAIKELPGEDTVCSLLGVWGMPRSPYIHDPYGKGAQYFDSCFGFIEQSVEMLGNEILKA